MNATGYVSWRFARAIVWMTIALASGGAGYPQSGGVIAPGSGQGGQAFRLGYITCASLNTENLGGKWRPEGAKNWYGKRDKVPVPPGTVTVEFKPVRGYREPANRRVVVQANKSSEADGKYTPLKDGQR
jgi:hypothetical protein